jgi:hypothetical protein
MHAEGMRENAAERSISDAMAKHTDAECLVKSAFSLAEGTESRPNDAVETQNDAQTMHASCGFPRLAASPQTFHCSGCIGKIAALSLLADLKPRSCIREKHSDVMTRQFGISKINPAWQRLEVMAKKSRLMK